MKIAEIAYYFVKIALCQMIFTGENTECQSFWVDISRKTGENEKSYPDVISIIKLAELYTVSLDELLKGDEEMIEHLEESTNIVRSNRKLLAAIFFNIVLLLLLIVFYGIIPNNRYFIAGIFSLAVMSSAALFYQIIKIF